MKLIFCKDCRDVVRLLLKERTCSCGSSGGKYCSDGISAIIWGRAIPLGIQNSSFVKAIKNQPLDGPGYRFESFVIPVNCPTVEKNLSKEIRKINAKN